MENDVLFRFLKNSKNANKKLVGKPAMLHYRDAAKRGVGCCLGEGRRGLACLLSKGPETRSLREVRKSRMMGLGKGTQTISCVATLKQPKFDPRELNTN